MRALILSALLLVTLPIVAAAPLTFEEVDTDGDGLISADEAASVEGLDFNTADGDNDGTLSVDEYDIALENLSPPEEDASPTSTDTVKPTESTTPASPAAGAAPTAPTAPTAPAVPAAKGDAAKPTTPAKLVAPPPATPKP